MERTRIDHSCESRWLAMGRGGADRKVRAIGYDSYNQELCGDVAQTVRLPIGGDNTAKVIVIRI